MRTRTAKNPLIRLRSGLLGGLVLSLAVVTAADETVLPENGPGACDGPYRAADTMGFDHAWSGAILLREMESACVGSENERSYWEMRATMENLLGNRFALEYFNRAAGGHRSDREFPRGAESRPALAYVVSRAASHQVVMVNERHHVSTERLLTLALLRPLYDRGFRYLAAEALWEGDDQLNRRGYPIRETGGYVSDVVFGELLRKALAIGYQVVPYEATPEQWQPTETMNSQQARDYWQAQNLVAATLKQDPGARVLVHCGYAHLQEVASPRGWTPMAHYFREATGLDPLTVDQTAFAEQSEDRLQHPWRLAAEERGLVDDHPVVLVDDTGNPLSVEPTSVDIKVLNPRTQYRIGRPHWMTLGGQREAVSVRTGECTEEACVVEAFHPDWEERAVPYDRVETRSASATMYFPLGGDVEVRGYHLDGSPAFRRIHHWIPPGTALGFRVPDPH